MSDFVYGDLLAAQVRAIASAVERSALAEDEFEWRLLDGGWAGYSGRDLPAIVHTATDFMFAIEYRDASRGPLGRHDLAGFHYYRRPGIQGATDTKAVRTWDELLKEVELWLRLIARELGRADVRAPVSESRNHPASFAEIWPLVHAEIREIAKPRFEAGQRADAVEAALKHVNELVQRKCRTLTGSELDGSALMKRMFSPRRHDRRTKSEGARQRRYRSRACDSFSVSGESASFQA